jgi:class 3 adenylate cyclase
MLPPVRFLRAADGVRLAYCAHGESGPPLVFVRGWMSHLETMWEDRLFQAYIATLARSFRVIRFDMRGMGLSDRDVGAIDVEGMVTDIEAIVDGLDLTDIVLYGQCYGGPPAMVYAAKHADRIQHLVLDGTYACGASIASPERQESFLATLRNLPEAGYMFLAHLTDPHRAESARPDAAKWVASRDRIVDLYALSFATDVTAVLSEIRAPTLVMHRRQTRAIPFRVGRELAGQIRGARFVPLPGDAHDAWHENAEVALGAIGDFLGVTLRVDARVRASVSPPLAIMFTDMHASTATTTLLGDSAAQEVVQAHDAAVRLALREHEGREVKHTGDGIMASFPSASAAIRCAIAVQLALAAPGNAPLVRIGINAGEPLAQGDDLFGTAVQMARRVCDAAAPGQILVSSVVRDLSAGKGFQFVDAGVVQLKGFEHAVPLHEVTWTP